MNEADSETWHRLRAAASLPCPETWLELADVCNSDGLWWGPAQPQGAGSEHWDEGSLVSPLWTSGRGLGGVRSRPVVEWERLHQPHKGRKGWGQRRDNTENLRGVCLTHKLPRREQRRSTRIEAFSLLHVFVGGVCVCVHECAWIVLGDLIFLLGFFSVSRLYFSSSTSFRFRNEVTSNSFLNTVIITKNR